MIVSRTTESGYFISVTSLTYGRARLCIGYDDCTYERGY